MTERTTPSHPSSQPGTELAGLDRDTLETLIQATDIETISAEALIRLFREEEGLAAARPDGTCQIDPRNGERILYNSSRSQRPHDNMTHEDAGPDEADARRRDAAARDCPICQGQTTGIVDVAPLGEESGGAGTVTFINKNLFPVVFPPGGHSAREDAPAGLHFLQWTSSLHDRDWHNMPVDDLVVAMSRLAALEGHLLANAAALLPDDGTRRPGHVSIIKNYGRQVGASLSHDHQQIVLSNVMPRRIEENRRFQVARGETFAAHLLRHNPAGLGVADYGPAVLLVPYCMRRPYDMTLIVKETDRAHLHELSADEIKAVARGWHDATRAIHAVMPELGREPAFNVVVHNGPGAGLYFEFLPYTQEEGGLEKLGLVICQQTPGAVALHVRQLLARGG